MGLSVKVALHEEVYQDLLDLEEEDAYREARKIIKELSQKPYMGKALEDREDLGLYLAGTRKIYFFDKKYRVVYTVREKEIEVIAVKVLAVGERANLRVYETANERLNE